MKIKSIGLYIGLWESHTASSSSAITFPNVSVVKCKRYRPMRVKVKDFVFNADVLRKILMKKSTCAHVVQAPLLPCMMNPEYIATADRSFIAIETHNT